MTGTGVVITEDGHLILEASPAPNVTMIYELISDEGGESAIITVRLPDSVSAGVKLVRVSAVFRSIFSDGRLDYGHLPHIYLLTAMFIKMRKDEC